MWYYVIKVVLTAIIIVGISEISKRSSFLGSVLASLPLTSLLAIIWLYAETSSVKKVSDLSLSIFWMVIPSLAFFIVLPLFLKYKLNFYLSLALSSGVTFFCYIIFIKALEYFNVIKTS